MIAEGVRATDLADYQRAARTLLIHPLVTTTSPDRSALALVRRFAATLADDLSRLAGYRLELGAGVARLVRRLDRLDRTQPVRRVTDRKPFDRRRYAYLCLVVAALGRAGGQVALTELADALRRRAAEIGGTQASGGGHDAAGDARLGFDPDVYRHRLAFVDVVRHLLDVGALNEVESSAVDWVRDPEAGEALYDVDRDVLHLLFVPPRVIQHVRSSRALLTVATAASRDTRRAEARQRLVRLLLEHPVVYLDDLDEAARGYLVAQARGLADDLERLTGGQLERRAEGVALIDATGGFSDRRFPTSGTAAQVALLIADAISDELSAGWAAGVEVATAGVPGADGLVDELVTRLDAVRPTLPDELADPVAASTDGSPTEDALRGQGTEATQSVLRDATTGPLFTTDWLERRAAALSTLHGRSFAAELRDDPAALADAAVEVLAAFDLVRPVAGGVVARPALARFRDPIVRVADRGQPSLLEPIDDRSDAVEQP